MLPEEKADPSQIWHPVNYNRFWTGLDGQWFPFRDAKTTWRGLSFRANYEYHMIGRDFAIYPTDIATTYVKPATVTNDLITTNYFIQPPTRTHNVLFGSG